VNASGADVRDNTWDGGWRTACSTSSYRPRSSCRRHLVPLEHRTTRLGVLPESARVVKATHIALGSFVLASVVAAGAAHADPGALNPDAFNLSGALDREVAPTQTALEIAVGGGYTQGAGGAGNVGHIEDLTGAGGNLEVQIGLRATPRFSVGVYGTAARFSRGDSIMDGSRAHGATAGVLATWHARETRSIDPWISVGAGWRGLWVSPPGGETSSAHGAELVRVQLGVDYRLSPSVAITPVIGASASVFLVENAATGGELTSIDDKQLNVYGFTGLLGRFDLGG